jgi:localization factor PodJL
MARAYPQPVTGESGADWQTLRGELAALLDQVEDQVARAHQPPTYRQPAPEPDRHRDALLSVQRAVDRFSSERDDMPANPRDTLQSAIDQIRSRQAAVAAPVTRIPSAPPAPANKPAPAPRYDEFANAMGGLIGRLERIEGEIKSGGRAALDVKAVGEQVAQLAHVVELLAGAVGETGQVKRIEGQIASLAKLVAQGQEQSAALNAQELSEKLEAQMANIARLVAQNQGVDVAALSNRLEGQMASGAVRQQGRQPGPCRCLPRRNGADRGQRSQRL